MVLLPPVEAITLLGPGALPGSLAYEPKFDRSGALIFTPASKPGKVHVQARRGSLVGARFPELATAGAQLPGGLVLDGELVVWTGDQLSFEALQRRTAAGAAKAGSLSQALPAYFVAFDALQVAGEELLCAPYAGRRVRLEELFTGFELGTPWTLCPMGTEAATAQEWLAHPLKGENAVLPPRQRGLTSRPPTPPLTRHAACSDCPPPAPSSPTLSRPPAANRCPTSASSPSSSWPSRRPGRQIAARPR
jgi:hypothetical protein